MKTANQKIFGVFGLLLISTIYSPAVTNVVIGIQGTNIVLNWPSLAGKIFLVEQRATLNSETPWGELTNYFPSPANTNVARFVHSNIVRSQPTDFYRVFDVTPVAHDDIFQIGQDSSANQLDIFQNDYSPNDDLFFISNLIPAHHGDISYSLDASTFQYTPEPGFFGMDSYAYSITSDNNDNSTNAKVTIFVNQSGNSSPSANDLILTLQTNIYTATFNALTNTTDPDGDTNMLFSVSSPSLGTVSTNIAGDITYTRNPNSFGNDVFTYSVTDGKGGYAAGNVQILQVDTDGDGMPDQWEMLHGLDPQNDDSTADPDNDGLPNLAEFRLGTNPRAGDNPLNFSALANGTLISNFAQLPITGLNPNMATPPIILYVSGSPAENSFVSQAPDGRWLMNLDTAFLTNGSYQVQLACQIATPTSPDAITTVLGTQKTVQVNNPIILDKLTSKFTDFLLINATVAATNDTYDVSLYDDDGNPLVSASGITPTAGQIQLFWDLTDGNGNQISFGNIQAVFTIHPPVSPHGVRVLDTSNPSSVSHWFIRDAANFGGPCPSIIL